MQENLKDILSNLSTEVDQETLLLYLQGKLTPEKQHELEKQMLDSEFNADALEGLQHFEDKHQLAHIADQLNRDLKKKTIKKKTLKNKQRIQAEPWLVITLIILLLLIVLSYFIIYRMA
jgi:hypothetical protein